MGRLRVDGLELELLRSERRSLSLQAGPGFGLRLRAPLGLPEPELAAFVRKKRGWIEKQLKALDAAGALDSGPRYREGGLFPFWGEPARLELVPRPGSTSARASREGSLLRVELPDPGDEAAVRRALGRLYLREARLVLPPLFEDCLARARAALRPLSLPGPELRIRAMRSRWGSCDPARRIVTLATALAEHPASAAEFVVMHELAHLRERNHDQAFYGLLCRLCPDWRERRAYLRLRRPGLPSI